MKQHSPKVQLIAQLLSVFDVEMRVSALSCLSSYTINGNVSETFKKLQVIQKGFEDLLPLLISDEPNRWAEHFKAHFPEKFH